MGEREFLSVYLSFAEPMSFCHKNSNLPFSINHGISGFFFSVFFSIFSNVFQFFFVSIGGCVFTVVVVIITSVASSYANVSIEQQHTPKNCSTKSTNNNSSEQTTIDGLIFAFLAFFRFNFLPTNNIGPKKTDQIHTQQKYKKKKKKSAPEKGEQETQRENAKKKTILMQYY